jgi:hypothetical protein
MHEGGLGLFPDPDADPDWSPYKTVFGRVMAREQDCEHCGRRIRSSEPHCSLACMYEAEKASRRVMPTEKTCEVCDKSFTPRRSDAKTCSDKCRQSLSRSKRKKGVTASRVKVRAGEKVNTVSRDGGEVQRCALCGEPVRSKSGKTAKKHPGTSVCWPCAERDRIEVS